MGGNPLKIVPIRTCRQSMSFLDSSIFESSNGENLAQYIRQKRGINNAQRIFDNSIPPDEVGRKSFPIEIERTQEEGKKTNQVEPLATNGNKSSQVSVQPPSNSISRSSRHMTNRSMRRRTLLKDFDLISAKEKETFNPEAFSTPTSMATNNDENLSVISRISPHNRNEEELEIPETQENKGVDEIRTTNVHEYFQLLDKDNNDVNQLEEELYAAIEEDNDPKSNQNNNAEKNSIERNNESKRLNKQNNKSIEIQRHSRRLRDKSSSHLMDGSPQPPSRVSLNEAVSKTPSQKAPKVPFNSNSDSKDDSKNTEEEGRSPERNRRSNEQKLKTKRKSKQYDNELTDNRRLSNKFCQTDKASSSHSSSDEDTLETRRNKTSEYGSKSEKVPRKRRSESEDRYKKKTSNNINKSAHSKLPVVYIKKMKYYNKSNNSGYDKSNKENMLAKSFGTQTNKDSNAIDENQINAMTSDEEEENEEGANAIVENQLINAMTSDEGDENEEVYHPCQKNAQSVNNRRSSVRQSDNNKFNNSLDLHKSMHKNNDLHDTSNKLHWQNTVILKDQSQRPVDGKKRKKKSQVDLAKRDYLNMTKKLKLSSFDNINYSRRKLYSKGNSDDENNTQSSTISERLSQELYSSVKLSAEKNISSVSTKENESDNIFKKPIKPPLKKLTNRKKKKTNLIEKDIPEESGDEDILSVDPDKTNNYMNNTNSNKRISKDINSTRKRRLSAIDENIEAKNNSINTDELKLKGSAKKSKRKKRDRGEVATEEKCDEGLRRSTRQRRAPIAHWSTNPERHPDIYHDEWVQLMTEGKIKWKTARSTKVQSSKTSNYPEQPSTRSKNKKIRKPKNIVPVGGNNANSPGREKLTNEIMADSGIQSAGNMNVCNEDKLLSWAQILSTLDSKIVNKDAMPNIDCDGFKISNIEHLKFEEFNGVDYAFYELTDDKFGYMRFQPQSEKPDARSKKFDLTFVALIGSVFLKIDKTSYTIKNGVLLTVRKGQRYSLFNPTNDIALLLFSRN